MRIMRNTNHMNYSSFWLDKSIWDTDNEPNKIEKKCVMNFYENNVVKENKTNIIIT